MILVISIIIMMIRITICNYNDNYYISGFSFEIGHTCFVSLSFSSNVRLGIINDPELVNLSTHPFLTLSLSPQIDNDGPYYWHIKSGTITRTPPEPTDAVTSAPLRAERRNKEATDQVIHSCQIPLRLNFERRIGKACS